MTSPSRHLSLSLSLSLALCNDLEYLAKVAVARGRREFTVLDTIAFLHTRPSAQRVMYFVFNEAETERERERTHQANSDNLYCWYSRERKRGREGERKRGRGRERERSNFASTSRLYSRSLLIYKTNIRLNTRRWRRRRRCSSCRSATPSNNVYWSVNTPLGISDAARPIEPMTRAISRPLFPVATRERATHSAARERRNTWNTQQADKFDPSNCTVEISFSFYLKRFSVFHLRWDKKAVRDPNVRYYWIGKVSDTQESSRCAWARCKRLQGVSREDADREKFFYSFEIFAMCYVKAKKKWNWSKVSKESVISVECFVRLMKNKLNKTHMNSIKAKFSIENTVYCILYRIFIFHQKCENSFCSPYIFYWNYK